MPKRKTNLGPNAKDSKAKRHRIERKQPEPRLDGEEGVRAREHDTCFLTELPSELLLLVANKLPTADDFKALRVTCRTIRDIVDTTDFYRAHWERWFGGDPVEMARLSIHVPCRTKQELSLCERLPNATEAGAKAEIPVDFWRGTTLLALKEWSDSLGRTYPLFEPEVSNDIDRTYDRYKFADWPVHPSKGTSVTKLVHEGKGEVIRRSSFLRNAFYYSLYRGYTTILLRLLRHHRIEMFDEVLWTNPLHLTTLRFPGAGLINETTNPMELAFIRAPLRDLDRILDAWKDAEPTLPTKAWKLRALSASVKFDDMDTCLRLNEEVELPEAGDLMLTRSVCRPERHRFFPIFAGRPGFRLEDFRPDIFGSHIFGSRILDKDTTFVDADLKRSDPKVRPIKAARWLSYAANYNTVPEKVLEDLVDLAIDHGFRPEDYTLYRVFLPYWRIGLGETTKLCVLGRILLERGLDPLRGRKLLLDGEGGGGKQQQGEVSKDDSFPELQEEGWAFDGVTDLDEGPTKAGEFDAIPILDAFAQGRRLLETLLDHIRTTRGERYHNAVVVKLFTIERCKGSFSRLRVLLERGAHPNMKDANGVPFVYHAIHRGEERFTEILLNHGADYDPKVPSGRSALHLALASGRWRIVVELLRRGTNPLRVLDSGVGANNDNKEAQRVRLLHYFLLTQPVPGLDLLKESHRRDRLVDCSDEQLRTILKELKNSGLLTESILNALNDSGRTPLYYVRKYGFSDSAQYLERLGAVVMLQRG